MKKTIIILCLGCLFLVINTASAMDIRADWPPSNWHLLAQGTITNIQNVGPFDTDAFTVRVGGRAVWFNPTAPFASEKTFERAFKMAMMFWATGVSVRIYGTDSWNAVSISPVY